MGVGLKANCFNTELFENPLKYAAGKFCTAELYYKMAMQFHNLNFTYELGIPNVVFNRVNKSIIKHIKQATEAIDKKEKWKTVKR